MRQHVTVQIRICQHCPASTWTGVQLEAIGGSGVELLERFRRGVLQKVCLDVVAEHTLLPRTNSPVSTSEPSPLASGNENVIMDGGGSQVVVG